MGKRNSAPKMPSPKKLSSGKWRVQVMVHGKRHSITCSSKKECVAKAAALKANEKELAEKPKKVTLNEAIDTYIQSSYHIKSPSTIRGYRNIQRNHFKDIQDVNIYSLTKLQLQQAVNKEALKLSQKSIKNIFGLLHATLKFYDLDIADTIRLPKTVRKSKEYLQLDEIDKLMKAIKGDSCEIPILLALWLGMRQSEILGLCWDCVNFDHSTLTVSRVFIPDEHHKLVMKENPKTASSYRTIHCPSYIMDMIKELPRVEDRVILVHPSTIYKHLKRACAKAEITITSLHGLRHTNAAVMKTIGVDDAQAMARGGWSAESTYKQTYAYLFNQKANEGDKKIDDFFNALAKQQ